LKHSTNLDTSDALSPRPRWVSCTCNI
jgi:hypothetical protein